MNFRKISFYPAQIIFLLPLIFILLLAGCGGGGSSSGGAASTATLTSITITQTAASIPAGTNVSLTAMGTYSDQTSANLTTQVVWSSADTNIASVGAGTGVVRGVVAGTTTITATYQGKSAHISVSVSSGGGGAATKNLATARYEHTADILFAGLGNESVLVAGGYGADLTGKAVALNSAELYDPVTDTWTSAAPFVTARGDHTSTQLLNGQVLLIGGANAGENYIASSELYIPNSGWVQADSLVEGRTYHTSTLLKDGTTVLAVGGEGNASANLASSELYDSTVDNGANKGTWKATGSLNEGRNTHSATLLPNGKVLVVGGHGGVVLPGSGVVGSSGTALVSAELYDPASGKWTATGSLHAGRYGHTATLLSNGKVLVAGGYDTNDTAQSSAELYDPATGNWSLVGSLNTARAGHTATLLGTGKVVVMGGEIKRGIETKSTEMYDPASGNWTATADLVTARDLFTATLLSGGKVLVSGGTDEASSSVALDNTELYW